MFPGAAPTQARNLALVEALFGRGVDLTAASSEGFMLLQRRSVMRRSSDGFWKLGADIDATSTGRATALSHAADGIGTPAMEG